jgi:iron complex outermembrane receptor protein
VLDFGLQHDAFRLRSRGLSLAHWLDDDDGATASRFEGRSVLDSLWLQDRWQFAPGWKSVLGLRAERRRASDGLTQSACCTLQHPARERDAWSPKLALARELGDFTVLKLSAGRAWRFPTVSDLYQGGFNARGEAINNNPDLRPERSWTGELSLEWTLAQATLRATLFHETTRDALYAQLNPATNANTVQNIERIRTTGAELAGQWRDLFWRGVDLQGSATYADSRIAANSGFVSVPGDTIGKWQPRVPRWRASLLSTWRADDRFSASFGMRYAGRQYNTLDNSDVNGFAYQGVSNYLSTDLRLRWRLLPRWTLAVGVDNLNNFRYWNFHPYPQRTFHAELAFDSRTSGDPR